MTPSHSLSHFTLLQAPILMSFFQPNEAELFRAPKMDRMLGNIILGTETYSPFMLLCIFPQLFARRLSGEHIALGLLHNVYCKIP